MNVQPKTFDLGVEGICGANFSPSTKLLMILLREKGPLCATQLTEILNGPREKTYERIFRPLMRPLCMHIVERTKWRNRKKNVIMYRMAGDPRDWLCNQLHPTDWRQIADPKENELK